MQTSAKAGEYWKRLLDEEYEESKRWIRERGGDVDEDEDDDGEQNMVGRGEEQGMKEGRSCCETYKDMRGSRRRRGTRRPRRGGDGSWWEGEEVVRRKEGCRRRPASTTRRRVVMCSTE